MTPPACVPGLRGGASVGLPRQDVRLRRLIGEGAIEALAIGFASAVVPHGRLDAEVARWCAEVPEGSPTAIAIAKPSFNADTDSIRGIEMQDL